MMEKVAKVGSVYGIMQEMMLQGLLQGTLTECFFYIMKFHNISSVTKQQTEEKYF